MNAAVHRAGAKRGDASQLVRSQWRHGEGAERGRQWAAESPRKGQQGGRCTLSQVAGGTHKATAGVRVTVCGDQFLSL